MHGTVKSILNAVALVLPVVRQLDAFSLIDVLRVPNRFAGVGS
jgi:hypothetical protein